jgi:hypothetical protein
MSEKQDLQSAKELNHLALGLSLGLVFGIVAGNIALGICLGIALGGMLDFWAIEYRA